MNKLCKLINEINRVSYILSKNCASTYSSYSKNINYKDETIYFCYDILVDRFMIIKSAEYTENLHKDCEVLYELTSVNFFYDDRNHHIPLSEIEELKKMEDIQLILTYGRKIIIDDELLSILENYNE